MHTVKMSSTVISLQFDFVQPWVWAMRFIHLCNTVQCNINLFLQYCTKQFIEFTPRSCARWSAGVLSSCGAPPVVSLLAQECPFFCQFSSKDYLTLRSPYMVFFLSLFSAQDYSTFSYFTAWLRSSFMILFSLVVAHFKPSHYNIHNFPESCICPKSPVYIFTPAQPSSLYLCLHMHRPPSITYVSPPWNELPIFFVSTYILPPCLSSNSNERGGKP